jgi:VanZ family protein
MLSMRPLRSAALALLVLYVPLVLWATLGPVPWAGEGYQAPDGVLDWRIWFDASTWTVGSGNEFTLNVLMFIPLGALLAVVVPGVIRPAMLAFGLTAAIELVQIPMADRISDPRDLAANAFGALIGVIVARLLLAVVRLASTRADEPRTPVAAPVAERRPEPSAARPG